MCLFTDIETTQELHLSILSSEKKHTFIFGHNYYLLIRVFLV